MPVPGIRLASPGTGLRPGVTPRIGAGGPGPGDQAHISGLSLGQAQALRPEISLAGGQA